MENQQRTEVCKPNGQLSIILGYRRLSVKFSCLKTLEMNPEREVSVFSFIVSSFNQWFFTNILRFRYFSNKETRKESKKVDG